ncbi:hypothetical protein DVR12_14225 [Chitinophaga silvatica]|uniref:Carbohydrate-binding family V/XII n=1 Tax=Chitinophaga silvatica TaxID=2282649 RepID=A0A3E1Y8Y3_9BACT|nr:hypothetical protein [Chitinophaga silvatica]RFS21811.1 hypothetical protein DVR12_14225 [Chitinophaga silvatica]
MLHHFFRAFLLCCLALSVNAQQKTWPKEIPVSGGGKITIYQPQGEKLEGNRLSLRAAVSVRQTSKSEPVFGVIWADALIETDKVDRTATLETLKITRIKIPDITDNNKLAQFSQLLETEFPKWNLTMSLDQLLTSIKAEQQIRDDNLNNNPPEIIYRTRPAMLVVLDGEPKVEMDKDLQMERVVNSPNLIIKNPNDKQYYLYGGDFWYSSNSITSGYRVVKNLPANIRSVDQQLKEKEKENNDQERKLTNPTPMEIIVRTQPAELIQTDGQPTYKNIQGTSLLFADNTLDDIFKDITDQKTYVLLAGRWYSAPSLEGKWTYVPSDKLPADFAKIPDGSDKDGVLANVAGTSAAEEAVADAQIPQTARVERTATTNVTYDGAPQFTGIENAGLSFAENSNITVLKSGDLYYAVDNGVWYVSNSPNGPWSVSTERPPGVDNIPPTSPVYNTKYVYIYDVTPQYIYTGYTPGYLNSYIYGPTVVWGTGWRYRPWFGHYFYPRPLTWGFGVSYNPWTGWNLGFNWTFNFGWSNFYYYSGGFYGGWFGPPLYRPPYRPWGFNGGYYGRPRPPHWNNNRPNINVNRPINQTRPNRLPPGATNNLYRDRQNIQPQTRPNRLPPGTNPSLPNRGNNNTTFPNRGDNNRLPNRGDNNRLPNRGDNNRLPNRGDNNRLPGGNNPSLPNRGDNNRPGGNNPSLPNRGDNNRLPGGNNPSLPNRGDNNRLPGGNNNLPQPNRPNARPSRGQNNIISDGDGNIYRRNQGSWQQRQNNRWQPAAPQQQQNMNRIQMQRDRGGMRDQNFSRPPQMQRPSGGGGARPSGGGGARPSGGGRPSRGGR